MAFLNTNNSILIDSNGNIYSFSLTRSGIELIIHEKSTGEANKSVITNEGISEYDVSINENNEIDLLCKKKDKSLSIYSLSDNEWKESKISKEVDYDICGIKIITVNETRHIFYYMKSIENSDRLSIYHHYLEDGEWNTNIIKEVYLSKIIKPIEVIKNEENLIIGYYDLGEYSEDIFISKFDIDKKSWSKHVNITNDKQLKLYLDILQLDDYIHITYSEYQGENLVIKHKRVQADLSGLEDISENEISNEANCTYPTLIYSGDFLWNVWTEYESVASAYSKDEGETWSNPYVWSESKKIDFTRGKFITTQAELKESYMMNYSFSKTYPELSLLGFGNLEEAVESIKKKEESEDEPGENHRSSKEKEIEAEDLVIESSLQQSLQPQVKYESVYMEERLNKREIEISDKNERKLEKRIDELEKQIYYIKKEISNIQTKAENTQSERLNKRISDIENQVSRRRSPFGIR